MLNADELAGMRATVTAALPDLCDIKRETAQGAYNPATLLHAAPTVSTLYTALACRVRPLAQSQRPVDIGDANEVLAQYVATVPYNTTGVDINDRLIVTTSTYDAGLVNQEFRIVEVQLGTWTVGRRLTLEKRQPIL